MQLAMTKIKIKYIAVLIFKLFMNFRSQDGRVKKSHDVHIFQCKKNRSTVAFFLSFSFLEQKFINNFNIITAIFYLSVVHA